MSEPRPASKSPLLIASLVTLAGLGATTAWLGSKLGALGREVGRLTEETAQIRRIATLMRLEDKSQGRGIGAILEQIEHYGPMLASAGTPSPTANFIVERLEEALTAVEVLGRDAFGRIQAELEQNSTLDNETRTWLLRAGIRADRPAGLDLAAQLARGIRMSPDPATRLAAARELVSQDKEMAGGVLRQILDIESSRGVTRQPPPELAKDYERAIPSNVGSQFCNFITLFAQTRHPDVEVVLRQILGRKEHDMLTYQECIVELGRLKSKDAVPAIKELYANPPGNQFNPMFLNHCVQAIADIDGADACEWMREQLKTQDVPLVQARLQDLVKQLCGSR
ncbi:MAG: hypothetical protein U1F36_10915 [Planctomycetota bacterium]